MIIRGTVHKGPCVNATTKKVPNMAKKTTLYVVVRSLPRSYLIRMRSTDFASAGGMASLLVGVPAFFG
jgi:hypothetical protein